MRLFQGKWIGLARQNQDHKTLAQRQWQDNCTDIKYEREGRREGEIKSDRWSRSGTIKHGGWKIHRKLIYIAEWTWERSAWVSKERERESMYTERDKALFFTWVFGYWRVSSVSSFPKGVLIWTLCERKTFCSRLLDRALKGSSSRTSWRTLVGATWSFIS